jgi:hypothetical protein
MKNKKVRKISVSKSGLIYKKLDIDNQTIGLYLPKEKEKADKLKEFYEKKMREMGVKLTYKEDIHHKKPFWKFWGKLNNYSIAVYKTVFPVRVTDSEKPEDIN